MENDTGSTSSSYDSGRTGDDAREQAKGRAEQEKARAGETVNHLAKATRAAADDLDQQGDTQIADVVRNAASQASRFADSLHNRNADDLMSDARRLAQTNPALFLGGSIAIGFALSRLFQAGSAGGAKPSQAGDSSSPGVSTETRR